MYLPPIIRQYVKQQEMLRFYRPFIQPGQLCFDIGANLGERTQCFLKLGARVICVEPQSACVELLKKKFRKKQGLHILPIAIGSHEGEAELMICDASHECSTLSQDFMDAYAHAPGFSWQKKEKVSLRSLEGLNEEFGLPDFCKVDVEGYESEVFSGLKRAIPLICFEFNKPLLQDSVKSLQLLGNIGNYHCNFIQYEQMKLQLDSWIPIEEFARHLHQYISPDILTGEIIVSLKGNKPAK